MQIRLAADLQMDSIVDGKGIRTVIWTQGCKHKCPFCHNPETWSFEDGSLIDVDYIIKEMNKLDGQDGITFSGGDPFYQPKECAYLAKHAHKINLNVWCYTGFTFEQLISLGKKNKDIIDKGLTNLKEKERVGLLRLLDSKTGLFYDYIKDSLDLDYTSKEYYEMLVKITYQDIIKFVDRLVLDSIYYLKEKDDE